MKRDMELVRLMLLAVEGSEEAKTESMKRSSEERAYHVALLVDVGFVVGTVSEGGTGHPNAYFVTRMTWAGHEFIDALRDNTIWKRAKEHVLKPGASWTIDILKEWAKHEIKQKLGLPDS